MLNNIIIRLKASFVHLLLSVLVISLLAVVIIFFWFPPEYLAITNFKHIALLIISIDLILGPLLTFFIYKPSKKSLKFDLAVIVAIQITALTYGVNALYQTHPLFITFNHGGFNLIHANEVTPNNAKYDEFKVSKFSSPKLAFAKMPDDTKIQAEIMLKVDLQGEPDIDKRTEYYEPYKNHLDTIFENSLDAAKLFNEESLTPNSKKFMESHRDIDNFVFLPLKGVSGDAIIVLDKNSAEVVTTIKANPWKFVKK